MKGMSVSLRASAGQGLGKARRKVTRLCHRPRNVLDYPAQWERVAHTRDGVEYVIRPIRALDLEHDRDFILGLSEESRYKRMMCTIREPSDALLDRFVHVDYHRDMAFVAVTGRGDDERIVAVARYGADPVGPDCEVAVAVTDTWQSRGVGSTLTRLLFDYARIQGIHGLHVDVLAHNSNMIKLAHSLGMTIRRAPGDPALIEASRVL
jgi:acetyltransferase